MTQTPPVSPDFAAMARDYFVTHFGDNELAMDFWSHEIEGLAESFAEQRAAGRAEGLAEAAENCDALAVSAGESARRLEASRAIEPASKLRARQAAYAFAAGEIRAVAGAEIRALASDPVAGDQVACEHPANDRERIVKDRRYTEDERCGVCGKIGPVGSFDDAPAPGLAAQEVERLRAIETAAFTLLDASSAVDWSRESDQVIPHKMFDAFRKAVMALPAALSAPRPAQAKESAPPSPRTPEGQ